MESTDHAAVRALIDRYLTPGKRWTGASDDAMRGHLRGCPDCARVYDRRVAMHRAMTGGSVELPSGLERSRMEAALLDSLAPAPVPFWSSVRNWLRLAVLASAVTAVVLFALPRPRDLTPAASEYVGARGGAHADVTVGIGVSGVTESGEEYEVVEGSGLYHDDYLRITTSREVDGHGFVAVLGFQVDGAPIWYAPNPDEGERSSFAVPQERSVALGGTKDPVEFKVSARHRPGRIVIAAVFTTEPLAVSAIEAQLSGGPVLSATGVADVIEARLAGLGADAVVRLKEFDVLPGSKRDEPR